MIFPAPDLHLMEIFPPLGIHIRPRLLGALEEATAHEARQDQGADDGNGQGTQVLPATKTWNSHGLFFERPWENTGKNLEEISRIRNTWVFMNVEP